VPRSEAVYRYVSLLCWLLGFSPPVVILKKNLVDFAIEIQVLSIIGIKHFLTTFMSTRLKGCVIDPAAWGGKRENIFRHILEVCAVFRGACL